MRVKFYREHKYVCAALNKLERLIAKTDFRKNIQINRIKKEWDEISQMLFMHAKYEEEKLHPLLEKKGSTLHVHAHEDHEKLDESFLNINALFDAVEKEINENEKIELGYQLYLTYRKFVGDNYLHLHEEETIILPELQRLYTDDELREVEDVTYKKMTCEQLINMLKGLFPHMNKSDKKAFLQDIKMSAPEKYKTIEEKALSL